MVEPHPAPRPRRPQLDLQDQATLIQRILDALSSLPVRAVVTLGQMVDPSAVISDDPDVVVVPSAPHEAEDQRQRDELEAEMQATPAAVVAELTAAQERWAAADVTDYELRFEPACLTFPSFPDVPPSSDRTQTVEVNDGVADGPWTEASIGATIDDWLSYLDGHLSAGGYAAAEFDPDLGYPVDIYVAMARTVHGDAAVSDDEFVLRAVVVTPR